MTMRTLVVHTGGIGDFLLACPSIRALSDERAVDVLGHTERAALAVAGGIADAAHALDSVDFDSVFSEPSVRLRDFLSRYDRAVVWMRDDDGAIADGIERSGVKRVDVFPGLPPPGWDRHASAYYLECLGLPDAPPIHLNIAAASDAHDVVIHPGSGSRSKNWPLDHFMDVAARLESKGRRVEWCLGPAELESGAFADLRDRGMLDSPSLVALAAHLANTNLYIGNDGGITHLAASVGCKVLAVFGSTDPRIWAPHGDCVTVVQGDPWPDVDRAVAAV